MIATHFRQRFAADAIKIEQTRPYSEIIFGSSSVVSLGDLHGRRRDLRRSTMKRESNSYFTAEQLEELAVAKYIEAALTPEGPERTELLDCAKRFANRAKLKSWLLGEVDAETDRRYH
jgi:hypothetical protein